MELGFMDGIVVTKSNKVHIISYSNEYAQVQVQCSDSISFNR